MTKRKVRNAPVLIAPSGNVQLQTHHTEYHSFNWKIIRESVTPGDDGRHHTLIQPMQTHRLPIGYAHLRPPQSSAKSPTVSAPSRTVKYMGDAHSPLTTLIWVNGPVCGYRPHSWSLTAVLFPCSEGGLSWQVSPRPRRRPPTGRVKMGRVTGQSAESKRQQSGADQGQQMMIC